MDRSIRKSTAVNNLSYYRRNIFLFLVCSIIFVVLSSFCLIRAGNEEELFLRANKCYEKHDCKQALALYQSIEHKGRAVRYNMGNCFYHLGDYPQALTCWKQAERGAAYAECCDIAHNQLSLAHKLGKKIVYTWWQRLYIYIAHRVASFSVLFLQLLFLACWFSLFFIFNRSGIKKFSVFIFIATVFVGASLGVKYKQETERIAIVMKKTPVFVGPDQNYHELAQLDLADQVTIEGEQNSWYKIKHVAGVGWVESEAVQII